jgi:hypothetical protein
MPNFISKSQLLRKKYEEKKHEIVRALPTPVSDICTSCWYRDMCIFRTILRQPPRSCCVYEMFGDKGTQETTLEELVKFTCDNRCAARQKWVGDPCPHNEDYCEKNCPVSRHIRDMGPARREDVPYEGY